MKDAFEKLFRAMHQFKKLNVSDLIPGLSSSEFSVMGAILQMGENGRITSSELAAKTKTLPPAVSRTLRGLEEKGYVERTVDKKDRRSGNFIQNLRQSVMRRKRQNSVTE